jgi:hypothetical protein
MKKARANGMIYANIAIPVPKCPKCLNRAVFA